jgi:hypothetical protein
VGVLKQLGERGDLRITKHLLQCIVKICTSADFHLFELK